MAMLLPVTSKIYLLITFLCYRSRIALYAFCTVFLDSNFEIGAFYGNPVHVSPLSLYICSVVFSNYLFYI